ncbi:MAG: hypothetical protein ABI844_00585, partial [Saprospiraceae bacterium]
MILSRLYQHSKNPWENFQPLCRKYPNNEFKAYVSIPIGKLNNDVHGRLTNKYDPEDDLNTIKVPFLSIMGEKDSWYRMQP